MSKYIAKKFEYIYLIGIDRYLMGFALASGRALRPDPRIQAGPPLE